MLWCSTCYACVAPLMTDALDDGVYGRCVDVTAWQLLCHGTGALAPNRPTREPANKLCKDCCQVHPFLGMLSRPVQARVPTLNPLSSA